MSGINEDFFSVRVIDHIPIKLNLDELLERYNVETPKRNELASLVKKYQRIIEAKAVYTFVKVKSVKNDEVELYNRDVFKGIILADMLEPEHPLFLFVVTAGQKVDEQITEDAKGSAFQSVYSAKIGNYAVNKASSYLRSLAEKKLGKTVSHFGPGTGGGKLFGIEQQKVLFKILDPQKNIGVKLMSNYIMVPMRSISGIYAVSRYLYIACQYCPREVCEGRTTSYIGEYHSLRMSS